MLMQILIVELHAPICENPLFPPFFPLQEVFLLASLQRFFKFLFGC